MLDDFERRLVNEVNLLVSDNERLKSDLEMARKVNVSSMIELLLLGAMLSDIAVIPVVQNSVLNYPRLLDNAYQTLFKRSPKAAEVTIVKGETFVEKIFQEKEDVEKPLIIEWKSFVEALRKLVEKKKES